MKPTAFLAPKWSFKSNHGVNWSEWNRSVFRLQNTHAPFKKEGEKTKRRVHSAIEIEQRFANYRNEYSRAYELKRLVNEGNEDGCHTLHRGLVCSLKTASSRNLPPRQLIALIGTAQARFPNYPDMGSL